MATNSPCWIESDTSDIARIMVARSESILTFQRSGPTEPSQKPRRTPKYPLWFWGLAIDPQITNHPHHHHHPNHRHPNRRCSNRRCSIGRCSNRYCSNRRSNSTAAEAAEPRLDSSSNWGRGTN
jgi:hypothetical protein